MMATTTIQDAYQRAHDWGEQVWRDINVDEVKASPMLAREWVAKVSDPFLAGPLLTVAQSAAARLARKTRAGIPT